jgi:hypothetical protein
MPEKWGTARPRTDPVSDDVGNPLLRKGGSQTLRQTFLCLFADSAGRPGAPIMDCCTETACGIRKGRTLFQKSGPKISQPNSQPPVAACFL